MPRLHSPQVGDMVVGARHDEMEGRVIATRWAPESPSGRVLIIEQADGTKIEGDAGYWAREEDMA